jgi:hypothetical protein
LSAAQVGTFPPDAETMSASRDHDETAHRNVICCLLALEIADYDAKPVFDQIRLTQDFRQLLSDATAHATSHDLVSMLREDGALLSFLADPEQCLTTALTIREAMLTQDRYRDLPLRAGINLGKAQIAEDEFGHPHVSGEGRQDADRLMRQGPPRQISVARQFVELLSRTAPELAELLEYQGLYSDTVGPPLCLYRVSPPQNTGSESLSDQPQTTAVSSGVIDAPTQSDLAPIAVSAQSMAKSRNWLRRSWLGYALLPLLAGAALVTLSSRLRVEAPVFGPAAQLAAATPPTTAPEAAASLPAPVAPQEITRSAVTTPAVLANDPKRPRPAASWRAKPRKEAAPAARRIEESAPPTFKEAAAPEERLEPERTAGAEEPTKAPSVQGLRSATLFLAVKPWGEIYVDGRKIGVTPPLKRLELAPGLRLITITNSSLPSYQTQLTVDPGAQMTVAHDFSCVSTREKTCREGFGKGLELHSRFRLETAEAGR